MLDAGRLLFQFLSIVLLILLAWSPRQPVFLAAVLVGFLRSVFADSSTPAQYMGWDAPTTVLRLLACLEAFWLRTGDVTRRWLLFALCLSMAAFVAALLTLAPIRESVISDYNKSCMVAYAAGSVFLGTLVVYSSFVPLQAAYRRDHWHVVLLTLFCFVLGITEAVPVPRKGGYELQVFVGGLSFWISNGLLLGWVITCGHLSVTQQLVQNVFGFAQVVFKRFNPRN